MLIQGEHTSFNEFIDFFTTIIARLYSNRSFWILLILPTLIIAYVNWIISDFKKSLKIGLRVGLVYKLLIPATIIAIAYYSLESYRTSENYTYQWNSSIENKSSKTNNYYAQDNKQRGIHLFSNNNNFEDIDEIVKNNFEWITLTPFIGQEEYNTPSLNKLPSSTLDRLDKKYASLMEYAKPKGIRFMLKPHIWLNVGNNGKFRSNIEMSNEQDWIKWFDDYKKILLAFANLAEKHGFEQLCIGTELELPATTKSANWIDLIHEIRKVYHGKLVYAANWYNEFEQVTFWDELDYIGIQAYFPLSSTSEPTLNDLEASWNEHIPKITTLATKYNKPVLFTEIGYRSIPGTAEKPWKWKNVKDYFTKISKKEQYLCYEAFFNTIWNQEWFHGLHIWEWQGSDNGKGNNTAFTLEGKPALNLIATKFGMLSQQ